MANQEHLDILRQGVEAWNQWRKEYPDIIHPDLSDVEGEVAELSHNADLSEAVPVLTETNLSEFNLIVEVGLNEANLSGADLSGANLSRADLSGASLSDADLTGAFLVGAILIKANLSRADLRDADLVEANLTGADLHRTNLSNAFLREADLQRATLVETNLTGATLTRCSIYGISAWDVKLEGAIQDELFITPFGEKLSSLGELFGPNITVDKLKVAQFTYLLINNQELRDVINTVIERGVLLLGRFSDGGHELLQSIAAELRKMKYLPMLFDFDRPDNRDYTETVKTLAGLARFVVVDLSGPSVPQELYATVPHYDIPFMTIIEVGRKEHSMFRDLLKYPWVFPPIAFTDKEQLIELLPSRIIEPAEKKCQERQALLNQLFHR